MNATATWNAVRAQLVLAAILIALAVTGVAVAMNDHVSTGGPLASGHWVGSLGGQNGTGGGGTARINNFAG